MTAHDALASLVREFDDRPYECRTCGARFELEHFVCPECEGFSVERF